MKRVERRGTLESAQLAAQQAQQAQQQAQQQQQQQQFQPRSNSHAQIPASSQGSDRSLGRSDTLLTNQTSVGPASFAQGKGEAGAKGGAGSRHAPTPPAIAALRGDQEEDEEDKKVYRRIINHIHSREK